VVYQLSDSEICPMKSSLSSDVRPLANIVLNGDQQLVCDDVNDTTSHLSSSLEGLRELESDRAGECRESLARNTFNENLELAHGAVASTTHDGMIADGDEEHRHVLTGEKNQEPQFTVNMAYKRHQNQPSVENVADRCRPDVERAVELSQQEHRTSMITADDKYAISDQHSVAAEPDNAVTPHHCHAGGDADVNHDIVPLPQPSTGRPKTSEHMSYKDDFTELSDNQLTRSVIDSRFVQLFTSHHIDSFSFSGMHL